MVENFLKSKAGKKVVSDLEQMYFYAMKDGLLDEATNREVRDYLDTVGFDFVGTGISKSFFLKQADEFM